VSALWAADHEQPGIESVGSRRGGHKQEQQEAVPALSRGLRLHHGKKLQISTRGFRKGTLLGSLRNRTRRVGATAYPSALG
jgi:hypothetical protein